MSNITKKFKVENMHCTNCERIIEKRMKSVDGVKHSKVDYTTEFGEVTFDPDKTDIKSIFKPVEEEDYKCSLIEDKIPKEDLSTKEDEKEQSEELKNPEIITINKEYVWKVISAILTILLISSIITGGFGFGSWSSGAEGDAQAAKPAGSANQPTKQAGSVTDMAALIDDDAVRGDENAPVTIVEWSDFECPFCTRFYNGAYQDIKKEYIDTGKAKFVYRDFPLSFHANAQKAAEAAECAGEQNKFWEMHDKIFENGVSGGVSSFKQYANSIGLDTNKFNECLDSGKMASEVSKDFKDGQAAGISGTPGFIINGQLVSGAQPFENFKQIIEAELAK